MPRELFFIISLSIFFSGLATPTFSLSDEVELAPVASSFSFSFEGLRTPPQLKGTQTLELWVVRPQQWLEGVPEGVEVYGAGPTLATKTSVLPFVELTLPEKRALFSENRALAYRLLQSVFEFRMSQVLRDFRADSENALPPKIREELASIKSGKRAFAILFRPGGFGPEQIELVTGVSYQSATGILSENRHKGRAVLATGALYQGIPTLGQVLENFTDNEFMEIGGTAARSEVGEPTTFLSILPQLKVRPKRPYLTGDRAEITTFAKNENSPWDLVPTIHQLLITLGITRFGFTPIDQKGFPDEWSQILTQSFFKKFLVFFARVEERIHAERKVRPLYSLGEYQVANLIPKYRRINSLVIEAVGQPKGKNPLSRMYKDFMGFRVTSHFPDDPDLAGCSTDLLEISTEEFELALAERFKKRPGAEILKSGEVKASFISYPWPSLRLTGASFFLMQPAHDRIAAKVWLAALAKDPDMADSIDRANKTDLDAHYCSDLLAGVGTLRLH